MSSTVVPARAEQAPSAARPGGSRALLLLALALALAPFVLSAVDVVLRHGGVALGCVHAVLELA